MPTPSRVWTKVAMRVQAFGKDEKACPIEDGARGPRMWGCEKGDRFALGVSELENGFALVPA